MKSDIIQPKISTQDHPERGVFFKFRPSKLVLGNGTVFQGLSPDWQKAPCQGEVVFNTGMTGYVESLTDPSYAGQILTFTFPLIGNYGVTDPSTWESSTIHARGVVVSEACQSYSHSRALQSLLEWLKDQNIPIITNVDTRALTQLIRSHGTMDGAITRTPQSAIRSPQAIGGKWKAKGVVLTPHSDASLVAEVSTPQILRYPLSAIRGPQAKSGKRKAKTVILVDCGLKQNILRSLSSFPVRIIRVPYDYDYSAEEFDGILLSNGPGDPTDCPETIKILKKAMVKKKPIFGICLGTQIMALAAGAKTYKLPFGHRGHNQPVIDPATEICYVTSQNHGYAIDEKTLPKGWRVSFRNLNDSSVEGIEHASLPFFAVQFHPEASPGPTDTKGLFDKFYGML